MRYLYHLTTETGHLYRSPRSEVSPGVLAALRGLLPGPFEIPGQPGYLCHVGAQSPIWSFDVRTTEGPLVYCVLCASPKAAVEAWRYVRRMTGRPWLTSELPQHPPFEHPWLAVTLSEAIAGHTEAMAWLGDFERCMGWALLGD